MSETRKIPGMQVITDPAFNDWFRRKQEEFFWCLRQPRIVNMYAGQVVVVHDRVILGNGPNSGEALEDARKKAAERGTALPAPGELLFVPIPPSAELPAVPTPPGEWTAAITPPPGER